MRGKIDLSWHKFYGLYRAPAKRERWRKARREKCPDEVYRQLWVLVAGAVRDTFANHPEYLTPAGRASAERSIVKRVTGTLHGYAAQAAKGRSVRGGGASPDAAAVVTEAVAKRPGFLGWLSTAIRWARLPFRRAWERMYGALPKFTRGPDER